MINESRSRECALDGHAELLFVNDHDYSVLGELTTTRTCDCSMIGGGLCRPVAMQAMFALLQGRRSGSWRWASLPPCTVASSLSVNCVACAPGFARLMIRQVPDNPESDEHGAQRLEHRPVGLGLGTCTGTKRRKNKRKEHLNLPHRHTYLP